jgi:hypothetical protein
LQRPNDVSLLPPELMRKGRFDEIFFVDLPSIEERRDIFAIHLRKRDRDPKNFDLDLLARSTIGYSGAEIESVVVSSLYDSFNDGQRELTTEDMLHTVSHQVPLSITMREGVARLREWAETRARQASSQQSESTDELTMPDLSVPDHPLLPVTAPPPPLPALAAPAGNNGEAINDLRARVEAIERKTATGMEPLLHSDMNVGRARPRDARRRGRRHGRGHDRGGDRHAGRAAGRAGRRGRRRDRHSRRVSAAAAGRPALADLDARIRSVGYGLDGRWGPRYLSADRSKAFFVHADETFRPRASSRSPLWPELFTQAAEGRLSLDEPCAGCVTRTWCPARACSPCCDPASFCRSPICPARIAVSDNTASNLCCAPSAAPTRERPDARRVWHGRHEDPSPDSLPSRLGRPAAHREPAHRATSLTLMVRLAEGRIGPRPEVAENVLRLLAETQDASMIPRHLHGSRHASALGLPAPPFTVRHKTGGVTGVRNDAGLVTRKNRDGADETLAICVFTAISATPAGRPPTKATKPWPKSPALPASISLEADL